MFSISQLANPFCRITYFYRCHRNIKKFVLLCCAKSWSRRTKLCQGSDVESLRRWGHRSRRSLCCRNHATPSMLRRHPAVQLTSSCILIYAHVCMCVCVLICLCGCVWLSMLVCEWNAYLFVRACAHMYVCMSLCVCLFNCMFVCVRGCGRSNATQRCCL